MNNDEMVYLARFLFPEGTEGMEAGELLQTAASAKRICRLKYCEGEHTQDLCLQVHKDRTIISSLHVPDAYGYELKEPGEVKRACYYLFNCFDFAETRQADVPALQMSKRKFEELRAKAGTYTVFFLAECLTAETGDLVRSAQLARVLKHKTADGELKLCSQREDGWIFQQAGYIEDISGGWLLRMSCESDWIIAIPARKAEVCSALYEWMLYPAPVVNPE